LPLSFLATLLLMPLAASSLMLSLPVRRSSMIYLSICSAFCSSSPYISI
jgi:hypothetical protein